MKRNKPGKILMALLALITINALASRFYARLDMTRDQRYTLSRIAKNTAAPFESPLVIDVLLGPDLPAEFAKLKAETRQLLEEFQAENRNIRVNFIDPLEGQESPDAVMADLQGLGLTPVNVTVEDKGKVSQEFVFPWALINHNNNTVKVALLKNTLGSGTAERVNNSVQNLEYAFADAFMKLGIKEKKRVAVLKGNGELEDLQMADYLSTIREYYNLGAITLDSVAVNPQKVLDQLAGFNLVLVAKPTEAFTEAEKYVLDQFLVQGGKSIWLIDQVGMELDSLFNETGSAMALPNDLNLEDLFFRYGIRINPVLVNDLYFTQIVLAAGEGNASRYDPVPWYYHPMVFSQNNHPVINNLEALRFQFANSIDTLKNDYSKTILYRSSPLSKADGVPRQISLDMIRTAPDRESYTNGNLPMAVLVEGEFRSAYANRVKPVALERTQDEGPENKMLVVADGDLIRNQLRNGRPMELGYDKWTNNFYGNKEFLINAINYLLDDTGLVQLRSKRIEIPALDPEKSLAQRLRWQLINTGLPLGILLLFGLFFNGFRKRKYGQ